MTFDGGDQRFTQLHATRPHRPVTLGFQAIGALSACGHRPQISARAEGAASASQHRHPRLLVRFKGTQGSSQRLGSRPINRIAHLGTVDDQGGDRAVLFDNDAHGSSYRYNSQATDRSPDKPWHTAQSGKPNPDCAGAYSGYGVILIPRLIAAMVISRAWAAPTVKKPKAGI